MSFERPSYDDVDFTRQDVAQLFQTFEDDDRLENRTHDNIVDLLTGDKPEDGHKATEYDSGHEVAFRRTDNGGAGFWGEYGPKQAVRTGDIAHLTIDFYTPDLKGEPIENKHFEIVVNNSAPYLDTSIDGEEEMRGYVEEDILGTLDVPTDYDEEELRSSYETAMTRIDKAQELQRIAKSSIEDFEV